MGATYHERAVGVLKSRVGRQNGVVGLDDRARELRGGVYTELELRLLAVVVSKTLHEESAEARAGTTAERVEDEEALQTRAVVRQTTDFVHDGVNQLLADGVVTTSIYRGTGLVIIGDAAVFKRYPQLLAASSFPEIIVSGWKRDR